MESVTIQKIRIDETDIFMEDMGVGAGKLTISNTYGHNYSTYWGSMGENNLAEFILRINKDYFVNRLKPCSDRGKFSGKLTLKNVRKHIREEMKWELPWYRFIESQKDLRKILKELERCDCQEEFVHRMSKLHEDVDTWDLDRHDEKEFKSALESLGCEPWHFIINGPSEHTIFLERLFTKLQKKIKIKYD